LFDVLFENENVYKNLFLTMTKKRRVLRRCVVQERGGAKYLEQRKFNCGKLPPTVYRNKFEWIWPHI